jgi:hypothetical protein
VKKIIIGLSLTLIFLLVIVAVFNIASSRREKSIADANRAPTPITYLRPTSIPISKETQQKIRTLLSRPMATFSSDQKTALQRLTPKLPYSSADFDMAYSLALNHFFVTTKTPLGYQRLKEFLSQNNALDLYLNGYGIITVTSQPVDQAEANYQSALREAVEDPETNKGQHQQGDAQVKGASDDNDLIKNLLDVVKGIVNSPDLSEGEAASNSPGGFKEPTAPGAISYPPGVETATPDENGYVELPESPNGEYQIYSCVNHRKGKKEMLGVLYTVALTWKNTYPGSLLDVGDINASGHASHMHGIDADIVVTDDSATNINAETYDKNRAVALGEMFFNTKMISLIFFNDANVRQAVNAYGAQNNLPGEMQEWPGHEDHFHVRITADPGPEVSPGC